MINVLKFFILVFILPSAAIASETCESALNTEHTLAITQLVKGYQAIEKATVEGQPEAARSKILKALNIRKIELEAIYGKENFIQIFNSIKNKISEQDNGIRQRRRKALLEENETLSFWAEDQVLRGDFRWYSQTKFSPDEKYILSCVEPNKAVVWDASTGEVLSTVDLEAFDKSSSNSCTRLDFSLDSRYIFKVINDKVMVWDINTGMQINPLPANLKPDPLDAKQMSPTGKTIFRFDEKRKQIFLSDIYTGQEILIDTVNEPKMGANARFSPDGRYIYAAYEYDDGREYVNFSGIWNALTGQFIGATAEAFRPGAVRFSDDSELIISAAKNKIRIWKTADASFVKEIEYAPKGMKSIDLMNVQMTPNKKVIMAGVIGESDHLESHILFFDFESGKLIRQLTPAHEIRSRNDGVRSAHINREGNKIVVGYLDSAVIWKIIEPNISEAD